MARAIRRALQQTGVRTEICGDPAGAVTEANRLGPRLVTLDLMMPGVSGLDLLAALRARPGGSGAKILVLSAAEADRLERAVEAGADAAMAKPFRNEELCRTVLALLGEAGDAGDAGETGR
jgi:DNA-binding response OmpR family regulator